MKRIGKDRQWLRRLHIGVSRHTERWSRLGPLNPRLWGACAARLHSIHAMTMSAALSYRTIFAIVPLLVLAFLVLRSVGMPEGRGSAMRQFLSASGFEQISLAGEPQTSSAPSTGPATTQASSEPAQVNVADALAATVGNVESKLTVGRVGPVGVVLLIWTAITLMSTVETSLNRIFGVERSRPLARRTLLYWSVLTLGPVVLVAAEYIGGRAHDTFIGAPGAKQVLAMLGKAGPAIVGIVLLGLLYKLMPNTRVRLLAAMGGAFVAVPIWLIAKWGFSLYITHVVAKGNIYGAMGLLPLFLFWLDLSWLIFLFGAELTNSSGNLARLHAIARSAKMPLGPSDLLAAALAVAKPYLAGSGPVSLPHVSQSLGLSDELTRRLLHRLIRMGVLATAVNPHGESHNYVLARPPEKIAISEVLELAGPEGSLLPRGYGGDIGDLLRHVKSRIANTLGTLTLAEALIPEKT